MTARHSAHETKDDIECSPFECLLDLEQRMLLIRQFDLIATEM